MLMVCAGFQLLESQYGRLLCGCNFMFEQLGIYLYYGCSIRLLPDWVFQNYVAHGVPSGQPTRPDGQHALQRFRCKNNLTFRCSTPAENTVTRKFRQEGCAIFDSNGRRGNRRRSYGESKGARDQGPIRDEEMAANP